MAKTREKYKLEEPEELFDFQDISHTTLPTKYIKGCVEKNTQGPFKALREKPFMEACKQEGEKRKDKDKEEEREKGGEPSKDGAVRAGESDV